MGDRQEEGMQVLLNVYDVTSTPGDPKSTTVRLNRITRELGLGGVFHGAIQLVTPAQLGSSEPVEFSFGWCERGTGVYAVHACQNPMYQYRETICLGSTPKTLEEVRAIIQDAKAAWPGCSYDLLLRNCCHFCEQLAAQLEVGPVPGWLNRFAVGAAATVSMTQETVKTVQEIGQELGRLSGESLSFLKASWQKTLAAASQQQQQLSERLQRQRELQGAAGSTASAAAAAGGRSAPDMHATAGLEAEAWGEQHPHLRSASEACIAGARSSSSSSSNSSISGAAAAWPPGAGAAAAASAGQSLLSGFQQGGRQLKALTSRLGARLMQQQQQHNPAADASLQDAAAAGQSQVPSAWQQQQQQPEYAGMSAGDYLQPRSAGQQAWQQPPVQQQEEQQQQQPSGSRLVTAVQPKLAPQFCVDGPDAAADPLASLLLDDAESPAARGSSGSIGGAAGVSGQGQAQQAAAQHAQHSDLLS